MKKCQYVNCNKEATHIGIIWGDIYHMCEEHYDLVGGDKDEVSIDPTQ